MGSYLATACKEVDEELGSGNGMEFGVGEMQGWRRHMEDAHISKADLSKDITSLGSSVDPSLHKYALFAVFDGHGGKEVAKFCKDHFVPEMVRTAQFATSNYVGALRETFHIMDAMIDDEGNAPKLKEYRAIPNPSDRDSLATGTEREKSSTGAGTVDSLLDPAPQTAGGKKIEYSRAMQLFKELLKQENEAKRLALGLKPDAGPQSKDEDALREVSKAGFDDDETDDPEQAPMVVVAPDNDAEDDGEMELDLEVHGACVPEETYKTESAWKCCQLEDHRVNAGCTAVVALRVDNSLLVANAGDSRAVLCRMGVAMQLSLDHKPNQVREYKRITDAGGFVNAAGRVNGNLNLSRAIGDLKYKKVPGVHRKHQIITADPDITVTKLMPGQDEFLILACDGIWDCFSSQEAVDFVRTRLIDGMSISQIIKEAFDFCLAEDPRSSQGIGADNMTLMIVKLKDVIV